LGGEANWKKNCDVFLVPFSVT